MATAATHRETSGGGSSVASRLLGRLKRKIAGRQARPLWALQRAVFISLLWSEARILAVLCYRAGFCSAITAT